MAAIGAYLSIAGVRPAPAQPPESAAVASLAALSQIETGNYSEAARQCRIAAETGANGPEADVLDAAILLETGNGSAARTTLDRAAARAPGDSLVEYAQGLCSLASGNLQSAVTQFDRSDADGGDPTALTAARRYAQWLGGAQIAVDTRGIPKYALSSIAALKGMDAFRRRDMRACAESLEEAEASFSGDPVIQAGGALMSFDPAKPITPAGRAPRAASDANRRDAATGNLFIAPENVPADVDYVVYELDGKTLNIINVRPFQYTWDSRRATNGVHRLDVILFDRDTHEISRTTRKLQVYNAISASAAEVEEDGRLRVKLWEALMLRPDRCVIAYTLGIVQRSLGDLPTARLWFTRAAAVDPNYRDARRQLASVGGLAVGGATVFGGTPSEKVIALTFDDGPKPGVTEPLLEMLETAHAAATFFIIGRHVMEYPDLTRRIAADGFEIANHSYTHRNLTKLTADDAAREVMETQAAIETVTGKTPRFLRPPGGDWNPQVARIVRDWGLTPCMWTVDVYGSEVIGAQQVANAVLAQVQNGSIILMHNGKVSTLQALPTIIRELRARGYTLVTVDEITKRLASVRTANPGAQLPRRSE